MKITYLILGVLIFIGFSSVKAQISDFNNFDKSLYPEAKEGYKQVYFYLPAAKNEQTMQVEIFVGQDLLADCNEYGIPGEILTEETVKKPSKTFYTAKINGGIMGTLIGCTDGIKTIKFITISPLKLQYNSKVPIVVYIPKEMDLRYRLWKADKKLVKPKLK